MLSLRIALHSLNAGFTDLKDFLDQIHVGDSFEVSGDYMTELTLATAPTPDAVAFINGVFTSASAGMLDKLIIDYANPALAGVTVPATRTLVIAATHAATVESNALTVNGTLEVVGTVTVGTGGILVLGNASVLTGTGTITVTVGTITKEGESYTASTATASDVDAAIEAMVTAKDVLVPTAANKVTINAADTTTAIDLTKNDASTIDSIDAGITFGGGYQKTLNAGSTPRYGGTDTILELTNDGDDLKVRARVTIDDDLTESSVTWSDVTLTVDGVTLTTDVSILVTLTK